MNFQNKISTIKEGEVIDFSNIDCFQWDYIAVIAPEFSKSVIKKHLDFRLPYSVSKKSEMFDKNPFWSLIFMYKKQPVHTIFVDNKDLTFNKYYYSFEGSYDFFLINKKDKFITYVEDHFPNGEQVIGVRKL